MELTSKAAYLKGLMDGMKIDESTDQGKLLRTMADIIADLAASVEDVAEEVNETVELVEILDKDLSEVEDVLFDDGDEFEPEDEEEPDDEFETTYECECPSCGDRIVLDETVLADGTIECPNCGEKLEFDFSDEE